MIASLAYATLPAGAQCWTTHSYYPQPESCGCEHVLAGSGSCFTSKEFLPDNVQVTRCREAGSGSYDCDEGLPVKIGIEWSCGDQGYDTDGVVACALACTGLTLAAILAALATGGVAAVLLLIAETGAGGGAIAACAWCNMHICGMYEGDPGTEIWLPTSAELYGPGCPNL